MHVPTSTWNQCADRRFQQSVVSITDDPIALYPTNILAQLKT